MELLRFSTAGSVDDGKSTLIGRLLYDTQAICEDQLGSLQVAGGAAGGVAQGATGFDLSRLTDGLKAEREQGITIDVAYRYFATPKRKFIIADTPGHEQYTRNMATGASTSDATVVLVDATRGLSAQSRRHLCIAHLLGIRHIIIAINKMDRVDYSAEVFDRIHGDLEVFLGRLGQHGWLAIPVSALCGDNVVSRSRNTPWYGGPALLGHLEQLEVTPPTPGPLRYPVQLVVRPQGGGRAYAGATTSGTLQLGQRVRVLPGGREAHITAIHGPKGPLSHAERGQAAAVELDRELECARGALLVAPEAPPQSRQRLHATLVWMAEAPAQPGRMYLLKQTSRTLRARIERVRHRTCMETLAPLPATQLAANDVGEVDIHCAQPLHFDPYGERAQTGAFILIDPETDATVAAGMIGEDHPQDAQGPERIDGATRAAAFHHRAGVLWLHCQDAASGGAFAAAVEQHLFRFGLNVYYLDPARSGITPSADVLRALTDAGLLVIIADPQPATRALLPDSVTTIEQAVTPESRLEGVTTALAEHGIYPLNTDPNP